MGMEFGAQGSQSSPLKYLERKQLTSVPELS